MKIEKGFATDPKSIFKIDSLNTSCKVTDYFRSKGKNIIPIVPGTKVPPRGLALESYFIKSCDVIIKDSDSIALLHGKISNTFAIDIDMKNGGKWEDAILIVAEDIQKLLKKTIVVKTPKQGCHIILQPIGELPPKNAKYFNKEGIEIDVKTQGGYTLLPPSIYTQKELGKYQFISETLETLPVDWITFESHLASKGFFLKEDMDNKDLHSDYDLDKLLRGKFPRGIRRKSLNSLYCKMRVRRWSENLTVKKIKEINRKLPEPLPDKELEYNIKYSESFFSHQVQPSLDDYNKTKDKPKNKSKRFSPYDAAEHLMEEFTFVSHISGEIFYYANGIFRKNGKILISKKCRQYWEVLDIDTTIINEVINIIRDKTTILSDDDNSEIFDTDYTKLILKNGMYDFENNCFSDYNSSVISTIKHPIFYDSLKECPKFDKFISSCFDSDPIRISQIWEMMALCLSKNISFKRDLSIMALGVMASLHFLQY